MAKQIKFDQIDEYVAGQLKKLISVATLETERRLKLLTPVDTGRLRVGWQTTLGDYRSSVFNNVAYAAPVIAGVDLPPSWGGRYRSRQGASPFLDVVAKDMQSYVLAEAARIASSS
jgi:hypothetical protein